MKKLREFWDSLRSSFWFIPSLMVIDSIVLAVVLIETDSAGIDKWLSQWPRMFGVGAEGARQILSTLAGSMMTVIGITFSMTLLALVLASGQYTSRILRNFMRSRVTQVTLGVFASIFTYCLIVFRTIRGGAGVEEFVPSLAVFFALIMSLVGIVILIYFIHHISSSIQASSIIASVAQETSTSIDRFLPETLDQRTDEDEEQSHRLKSLDDRDWYPVPVAVSGYIKSVNNAALMTLARKNRTIVRMEHGVGKFVVQNTALLSLALTYPPDQKMIDEFNTAYSIGPHRTVEQDPSFGFRQIVDIAIKALSPGVNDTSTAVMCVDYLTALLAQLTGRQFPPTDHYEGETLRVIAIVPSFEVLLALSFDQIRGIAEVNVAILARLLSALDTIGSLTIRPNHLRALDEQVQCIADLADRTIKATNDRTRLKKKLSKVRETLEVQSAIPSAV